MYKKKYVMPFIAMIIVCIAGGLLVYPMINMSPKDIKVGITTLDKGHKIAQDYVDLGKNVIESITETKSLGRESIVSAIDWEIYNSEEKMRNDIKNGKIYGGFVIPENFTELKTLSLAGYSRLNDGIMQISKGMSKVDDGVNSFEKKLSAVPLALKSISDGIVSMEAGLTKLDNSIGSKDSKNTLLYVANSVNQSIGGTDGKGGINGIMENLRLNEVSSAEIEIRNALYAINTGNTSDAIKAMTAAQGYLNKTDGTLKGISEYMKKLGEGSQKVTMGLEEVKRGSYSLKNGALEINGGLKTFFQQSNNLVSASGSLSMATGQLDKSLSQISDTVSKLVEGSKEQLKDPNIQEKNTAGPDTASIVFILNQSKNTTIGTLMEYIMSAISAKSGIQFEMEYISQLPPGMGALYFGTCVFLFVYIASYAAGVVISRSHSFKALSGNKKRRAVLLQLAYIVGMAVCFGILITQIIVTIGDTELPILNTTLFLTIASFALITLVAGSIDLFGMAGMAIPLMMLVLGLGTANLPYEFLPEIWQKWIYPWMPLRIISDGIKKVVYSDIGWWNDMTAALIYVIIVGIALILISAIKPVRKKYKYKES